MDVKNFDWRSIQKYFNPQAAEDLNVFLENMPQTAGQTALIAAGIAWMAAGALGLYTFIQVQNLTELRAELKETQALKPLVPIVRDVPVRAAEVTDFVTSLKEAYPNLDIKQQGASIQITARSTAQFGAFRESIGHVQNGGTGWRVNVSKLCVGRECEANPLGALLKINKVSVDKPTT